MCIRDRLYTDDYVFDVEKKDSIKTLLLTLWKSEDDKVTKTDSGELGSAVNAYIECIRADRSIVPSFNTFYEYMRDDYRRELAEREIKVCLLYTSSRDSRSVSGTDAR